METVTTLNTDGSGLWSRQAKPVTVTGFNCVITKSEDEDPLFGELMVRFDTESWNTDVDGLIYTDRLFLKELCEFLKTQGFSNAAVDDVSYSEQGMQGDEYVSLDAGHLFCEEYLAKFPDTEIYEY